MPFLGDFIGQIAAEMTIARMQADLEAVRVAELYASHPLLRNMPVPHFRLPDISIEIPVVIKQTETAAPGESPRGSPNLTELKKIFLKTVSEKLLKDQIRLSTTDKDALNASIEERVQSLKLPAEIAVGVSHVAHDLADLVSEKISERIPMDVEKKNKFRNELKELARSAFLKVLKPPPRLEALVKTSEVREAGAGEIVTRIQLKLSEDGFEITTVESDGVLRERLIPE